jgi:hypothetical protein
MPLLRTVSTPLLPSPSVPRPWISRAQEPGAHGRIADGGSPESRLGARKCCSAGGTWTERAGYKTVGSAYVGSNPTPATQHLPQHFRRSKPMTSDGVTGFCVPERAVYGPLMKVCGPAVGRTRVVGRRSDRVLIFSWPRETANAKAAVSAYDGWCHRRSGAVGGPGAEITNV